MLKIIRRGSEKEKTLAWQVRIFHQFHTDGVEFTCSPEDVNFLGGVESMRRLFSGVEVKRVPEWNALFIRRNGGVPEQVCCDFQEMGQSQLLKEWLFTRVLPKAGDCVFVRFALSKMPPMPGVVSHFDNGMVFVTGDKNRRPMSWFHFRRDVSASTVEWKDWREDLTNLIDDLHEVPRTSTGWLRRSFRRWESGTHVSEIVLWIEKVYGKDSVPMTDMQLLYSDWSSPEEDEAFLKAAVDAVALTDNNQ